MIQETLRISQEDLNTNSSGVFIDRINKDTINLYKESTFSQYLVHGDESKFSINLKSENNFKKLEVRLCT